MPTLQEDAAYLAAALEEAQAIVVGAAAGMSAASGFRHYYERDEDFVKHFGDFEKKYGYHCTFDGVYYPYASSSERWAFFARLITTVLEAETGKTYLDISKLLENKNFHILTTNQDAQFPRVFPEGKISAIQGDLRYLQCSRPCHDALYPAEDLMKSLNEAIDADLKIPADMVPRCPRCGAEMEPWVRSRVFLEGRKYKEEYEKLNAFLEENKHKKILFLELGVGRMTPMFIQEPFWRLTYSLPNASYISINPKDAIVPDALAKKGAAIHRDIAAVLDEAVAIAS